MAAWLQLSRRQSPPPEDHGAKTQTVIIVRNPSPLPRPSAPASVDTCIIIGNRIRRHRHLPRRLHLHQPQSRPAKTPKSEIRADRLSEEEMGSMDSTGNVYFQGGLQCPTARESLRADIASTQRSE